MKESVGEAVVSVVREHGADGDVQLKWKMVDKTAIMGEDYMVGEGVFEFKHGETQRVNRIAIVDNMDLEKDENCEVELYEVNNGGKLGKITMTAVTVTNDDEFTLAMLGLLVIVVGDLATIPLLVKTCLTLMLAPITSINHS